MLGLKGVFFSPVENLPMSLTLFELEVGLLDTLLAMFDESHYTHNVTLGHMWSLAHSVVRVGGTCTGEARGSTDMDPDPENKASTTCCSASYGVDDSGLLWTGRSKMKGLWRMAFTLDTSTFPTCTYSEDCLD